MKHTFIKTVLFVLFAGASLLLSEQRADAQKLGVSTNAVDYLYFGTLNAEAQYALAQHWSVSASFRYNPFTYKEGSEEQFQQRQRTANIGSRYWTWNTYSGWWFAAKAQWQEFNEGGIATLETSEGDRYGAGLSAGYTIMLNKNFNIDLGLGLWGGYEVYTTYACPNCGRIVESGEKSFILPNEASISLLYIF